MVHGALLALLVAAVALPVCAADGRLRYCDCLFQNNRHTQDRQVCPLNQEDDEAVKCRSEMKPYISNSYTFYSKQPQRMFRLFRIEANSSTADQVCRQEGGRLATPQNNDVYNFILTMMKKIGVSSALIGYTDEKQEGVWTDFDGNPAPKIPWKRNMPDNWKGDEDCTHLLKDGVVNDLFCSDWYSFTCERRLTKLVPKGYEYYPDVRIFYKLYRPEKTFKDAWKICQLDGGKLAVPENFEQLQTVMQIIYKLNFDIYVDFTDEAEEGYFVTSDGRSMREMQVQLWREDEPDNGAPFQPAENCVTLNARGHYADVPCHSTQPFVCQLEPF